LETARKGETSLPAVKTTGSLVKFQTSPAGDTWSNLGGNPQKQMCIIAVTSDSQGMSIETTSDSCHVAPNFIPKVSVKQQAPAFFGAENDMVRQLML
jgi:hypothetical protein